ncbi:MAG: hypothetical protein U0U70_03860 [Chitinophagaceae bacterium]
MKFLIGVLAVRFIIELFSNKNKNAEVNNTGMFSNNVRHPAEFLLR